MKKRLGILNRDMNLTGFALVLLLLLQYLVAFTTFYIIARCGGHNIAMTGFSPRDFINTLAKLRNAVWNVPEAVSAALLLSVLIGNIVPLLICAKLSGIKVSGLFSRSQIGALDITIYGIIAIGSSIMASMVVSIISLILKLFNMRILPTTINIPFNSVPGIVMTILAVVVAAPVTEELICRGVILKIFRRYGDVFAIVGSALVWALLHGNLTQGLPVFVMGLFFGLITIKSGSIIPTVILHCINNALSLAQMAVAQAGNRLLMVFSGLVNISIFLVAIVLAAVYIRKLVQIKDKQSGSARGFSMFFTCIPILVTIFICAASTALTIRPL